MGQSGLFNYSVVVVLRQNCVARLEALTSARYLESLRANPVTAMREPVSS